VLPSRARQRETHSRALALSRGLGRFVVPCQALPRGGRRPFGGRRRRAGARARGRCS
jgi:hypothetical protein